MRDDKIWGGEQMFDIDKERHEIVWVGLVILAFMTGILIGWMLTRTYFTRGF